MFEKIHIQSYRSCKDVFLDNLRGTTALIGRNGVGKTNILRAIQWAMEIITTFYEIDSPRVRVNEAIIFTFIFTSNGTKYHYIFKFNTEKGIFTENLQIQFSNKNEWKDIFIRNHSNISIPKHSSQDDLRLTLSSEMRGVSCLYFLQTFLPEEYSTQQKHIINTLSFFTSVRYYSLDEENIPKSSQGFMDEILDYEEALRKKNFFESKEAVTIKIFNLWKNDKDKFNLLKLLLGEKSLNLIKNIHVEKITNIAANRSNQCSIRYTLSLNHTNPKKTGHYSCFYTHLSYGTRRILRILTAMLHDNCSLLMFEQPEDGIHIALLEKLIATLKSYDDTYQFMFATHSPTVLNCLAPQDIRLVTMEDGQTHVRTLNDNEIQAAQHYLKEEGTLADFLEIVQEED